MKWLLSVNCPWDTLMFEQAVLHANLENVKWLLSVNCPWDEEIFARATVCISPEAMMQLMWLFVREH